MAATKTGGRPRKPQGEVKGPVHFTFHKRTKSAISEIIDQLKKEYPVATQLHSASFVAESAVHYLREQIRSRRLSMDDLLKGGNGK